MGERIIETWIQAKHPNQELCEDGLYTGSNYYAVIDGVTSKGSLVWPGEKTGGRFAKDVLLEALETLPADMNAKGAVSYLNDALREASFQAAENPEVLERVREERPQAVLIVYSRMRREVWCFGDCQCMIGGRLYRKTTVMDELTAGVRSAYNQLELAAGKTLEELAEHDTGREYIMPLLVGECQFANGDGEYSYDVLDGFPIHEEHTQVYPVRPGEEVVLASDGYPELFGNLAESESVIREVKETDPMCMYRFKGPKGIAPGFHSFDDRTYLRFILEEN